MEKTGVIAKAMVLTGPNSLSMQEFAIPELGPENALVKIELAGVCATDPKYVSGHVPLQYPVILGHELVGKLEWVGDVVARRFGVVVGDRVAVEASVGCGYCSYCLSGNYNFCNNRIGYGQSVCEKYPYLLGGYAQYLCLVPGTVIHRLPDDLTPEEGVLICSVVANGIEWVKNVGKVSVGDAVVVQGVGSQGLACIAVAKEAGARVVIATGKAEDHLRFQLAREMGADVIIDVDEEDLTGKVKELTSGKMADVVVDTTGNPVAINNSVNLAKKLGKVISAGVTGNVGTTLSMDKIVFSGLSLIGVFSKTFGAVDDAINLVHARKYPYAKFVSQVMPLASVGEAVKIAEQGGTGKSKMRDIIKVVIDPWI